MLLTGRARGASGLCVEHAQASMLPGPWRRIFLLSLPLFQLSKLDVCVLANKSAQIKLDRFWRKRTHFQWSAGLYVCVFVWANCFWTSCAMAINRYQDMALCMFGHLYSLEGILIKHGIVLVHSN